MKFYYDLSDERRLVIDVLRFDLEKVSKEEGYYHVSSNLSISVTGIDGIKYTIYSDKHISKKHNNECKLKIMINIMDRLSEKFINDENITSFKEIVRECYKVM